MRVERKIRKRLELGVFGIPIILENVPMIRIEGEWTPDIDYNRLGDALAIAVSLKPARLTGNEISFVRKHLGMTQADFGRTFGGVSRVAVFKWERSGDQPTRMGWLTEKDLRLHTLEFHRVPPHSFARAYQLLGGEMKAKAPLRRFKANPIPSKRDILAANLS